MLFLCRVYRIESCSKESSRLDWDWLIDRQAGLGDEIKLQGTGGERIHVTMPMLLSTFGPCAINRYCHLFTI